jgi:hypothetical protein
MTIMTMIESTVAGYPAHLAKPLLWIPYSALVTPCSLARGRARTRGFSMTFRTAGRAMPIPQIKKGAQSMGDERRKRGGVGEHRRRYRHCCSDSPELAGAWC